MKIHLLSDLHLEFAPFEIVNKNDADILVLSGDILVAQYFQRGENSPFFFTAQSWLDCLKRAASQYREVFYVLGNHEHYKGKFQNTLGTIRANIAAAGINNITVLDNESVKLDNYLIVGTTLWTDFDNSEANAALVQAGLNDYHLIQSIDYRKLRTWETKRYFEQAIQAIQRASVISNNVLVFSHHAPSYRSVTPEYQKGQYAYLNSGYCSHLDEFIREHPEIKAWTHGHVHSSHDYDIGTTRIVANPRGYANRNNLDDQENKSFDPYFTFEV